MKITDLYQEVTDRIVRELQEGTPPWVKPWKDTKRTHGLCLMPANAMTGRPYSGINVLLLWAAAQANNYPTHAWATFQQANVMNARVRKGEHATPVTYFKKYTEDQEDGKKVERILATCYYVFNLAQLDDVPAKYLEQPEPTSDELTRENAKTLMRGLGVKTVHGGNQASYSTKLDQIVMPLPAAFESEDEYWGTAFHELTHATGHESRLKREFGKRFGDNAYAFEELVAELGSAFLCAQTGIPASYRSAAYLDNWLKVLQKDNRAIFSAAGYASTAATFAWEKAFYAENEETPLPERSSELAAEAAE